MSLDDLLARTYHRRDYHCVHFARDVWLELTGEDLTGRLGPLLDGPLQRGRLRGASARRSLASFQRLDGPASPCIALMQRPHSTPHFGVYFDGGIMHLHGLGAEYHEPDVAMRGFREVSYYR